MHQTVDSDAGKDDRRAHNPDSMSSCGEAETPPARNDLGRADHGVRL